MADAVVVGLYSWIIEDGNYPNFVRDTDVAFALEFYSSFPLTALEPEVAPFPSMTHIGDNRYDVSAHVVYRAENWWAIDAGLLAYMDGKPPIYAQPGRWLSGEIHVGVDPFFYFENFGHGAGAPPLVYDWKVEKIEAQTAPRMEVKPRFWERDPAKLGWEEIIETNAGEDSGEYLLHCRRIGGPRLPRNKRQP